MGALAEQLPDRASVAFDTNALIYYVEQQEVYLSAVEEVIEVIIRGQLDGHASVVTLTEVLVLPLRHGQDSLAEKYRDVLSRAFTLHEMDRAVAESAAEIRAAYGVRTPDAIVCATAIGAGCGFLLTNDPALRRVPGIRALVIKDYV